MEKEIKICLLGVSFNTNNLGVNVLASGLIKCALTRFPQASISILDYGKKPDFFECTFFNRIIKIPLVNIRFSIKLFQSNNIALLIALSGLLNILPFKGIKNSLKYKNKCLRTIMDADIIGSIAGGDSFSDIYGFERILYVGLPQILAILLGKKLIQFPQTYGPFKSFYTIMFARFILKHSNTIYSRDYEGVENIKKIIGKKSSKIRIKFAYDVGFVLDPIAPVDAASVVQFLNKKKNSPNIPFVGLNVSGLLYIGGYTNKNMFGLKIDYISFVQRLIRLLIYKYNANVVLVPHVLGGVENMESDMVANTSIFNKLSVEFGDSLLNISDELNQNEIKYIIGYCDFFIGSRMHACIAALSQCIPAIGIAYSKKFIGVMQSIGVESLVVDPTKLNADECIDKIDELYKHHLLPKQLLTENINTIKDKALNLFSTLP